MWFTYILKYYSAIKNKDIMNFASKWIDLENIILREVAHPHFIKLAAFYLNH